MNNCECGCGQEVKFGSRFLRGHYARCAEAKVLHLEIHKDKKSSKETCKKISEAKLGKKLTEDHKQKLKGRIPWNKCKKGLQVSWNKGLNLSEETKKKISKARKGKYSGENNPMFGIMRPDLAKRNEQNRGKPSWNKGLSGCYSDATRIKWKLSRSGENNHRFGKKPWNYGLDPKKQPNWKGGTSLEPYCIEFTNNYKEEIKERDGYKCSNPECSKDSKLVVHHINYNKIDCDWWNLITVCNSCNSKANYNRTYWQTLFSDIMGINYGNV